jgi:hypothetical protein
MRAAALASLAAAAILAGCGSDETTTTPGETASPSPQPSAGASSVPAGAAARRCPTAGRLTGLRVSGLGCEEGRRVMSAWNKPACLPPTDASRSACTVRRYRCQAIVVARGLSASCAKPGRSVSFLRRK